MKLIEAISRIDNLKHNTYPRETKVYWLSIVDGLIKRNIVDAHEGSQKVEFRGYTSETPDDTVLLVPEPYDELYLWWLASQIDYCNGEMTGFNNSIELFNNSFNMYAAAYTREHKPLQRPGSFF